MPELDKIKPLLIFLGIPLSLFAIIIILFLTLWLYPQLKIIVSDLLRILGKTSRWIRKKSIETELEGSISLFKKQFNSELSFDLLPECSIQWIAGNTPSSYMTPGKAIIKMSFGEDHDLNFYNVVQSYLNTALLEKTKPFLISKMSRAIDLLITKGMLLTSHRQAINIFNRKFRDESDDVKGRFHL